jgi:hypothetical protein
VQRRFPNNSGSAAKPDKQLTYETREIQFSGNSISGKLQTNGTKGIFCAICVPFYAICGEFFPVIVNISR